MTPEPGGIVAGRYQLDRCVARGGMGTVWVATHLELESPVAIKFIDSAMSENEEWRARFGREAKAAATLRSPHVVQILDYGSDDDVRFIVMELLEGENLRQRISRLGRLPLSEASVIVNQVCKALALATSKGILHRDLKPSNIFLARVGDDEIVKVLDFGVAKDTRGLQVGPETTTGVLVGSPHYMSPEQTRGTKSLDHRSDLWSVAVILYMMLTGVRPFEGTALGDLIIKIYTEEPAPPSSHFPELSSAVDAFFERALSRQPERRFQSAREFATMFAGIVADQTGETIKLPSIPLAGKLPEIPPPSDGVTIQEETRSLTAATLRLPTQVEPPQWLTKQRWWWYAAFAVEVSIIIAAFLLGGGGEEASVPASGEGRSATIASPEEAPDDALVTHGAPSVSASSSARVDTVPTTRGVDIFRER
jgi:serine/threonine protein kinase